MMDGNFTDYAILMFVTWIIVRTFFAVLNNEPIQEALIKFLIGLILNAVICWFIYRLTWPFGF